MLASAPEQTNHADMKANWRVITLATIALGVGLSVNAQQTEAVRKLIEETRVKAEQGDADAQNSLGFCYSDGAGVAKDSVEAVKWFRKAADQGDEMAQFNLGLAYQDGSGVEKDAVEAVKWFRKAAEQNFADAQYNLGVCYFKGNGIKQNYQEAVKWFRKAAEQGDAAAQVNLGVCYIGGKGVTKNDSEAIKWWRKSAEQGDALAQVKLGLAYGFGNGVAKDAVQAAKWYRKAAENGNVDAQYSLGACYAKGDGEAKDYVEAHKWFNLASAQGYERAKESLLIIERLMTTEQIAEAQRLVRELKLRKHSSSGNSMSFENPLVSGTGFFITADGFLITNEHVVRDAVQVRLVTRAGLSSAKVANVDAANDLALLKTEGKFSPLPLAPSRGVKLGGTVATVGFPNIGLQGFAPKLAP